MRHEVDREGGTGGGSGEGDGSDLSSFMQRTAPWKKRPLDNATSTHLTTSVRRLMLPTASSGSAPSSSTREEPVDDLGGNETHDEAYHRLRTCMGVAEETEPLPRASGFSNHRMEEVSSCLSSAGEAHLIARLGQLPRIVGHLLEGVGYLCERQEPGAPPPEEEGAKKWHSCRHLAPYNPIEREIRQHRRGPRRLPGRKTLRPRSVR